MRRVGLLAVAAVGAALAGAPAALAHDGGVPAPRAERIGRSVEGRPIGVVRIGDPAAPRKLLVVGCIHGDECAGRAWSSACAGAARRPPASSCCSCAT